MSGRRWPGCRRRCAPSSRPSCWTAGAWPAVAGISGVAVVVGGCGAAFPAAATVLLPTCFVPLAAGALVLLAAALRGQALPWTGAGLALAGNVLLGFAVVLVLMAPSLVPQVARWVRTFPAPGGSGPSSESRVVDRPRGVRGGHRHLDRRPKPAPADVQCSVIPATTA
jgi:hypothetical protein